MSVDVDKIKDKFLNRINTLYNQEVYFVDNCVTFPEKYPLTGYITDLQLQIFFEENNNVVIAGRTMKYCDKDAKRKIKLLNITDEVGSPDINIVNNYITDDRWEKIEW